MLKKCFILTQFGTPHIWSDQYFQNVAQLEKSGWHWLIFTPNKYENVPNNVKIIPMTIEGFDALIKEKLRIQIDNSLVNGVPVKNVSDFYVASGKIFEDYLKDTDFWGITNWDIVYGRLSHFIPDTLLEKCDIFSDDVYAINGIFCLFRNNEKINNLFKKITDWENKFRVHKLVGTDEYDMTEVVQNTKDINFIYPNFYPLHSHDRLEQHTPNVKLAQHGEALFELFKDTNPPQWTHKRIFFGREIPMFHFLRTKVWPLK